MTRFWLIAQREFRTIALRPRFLLLVLFPLLIGLISFGSSFMSAREASGAQGYAYLILDPEGQIRQAVGKRGEANNQLFHLQRLAVYLDHNHLQAPMKWGRFPDVIGGAELAAFQASGGVQAALKAIEPKLTKDTPRYAADPIFFVEATIPAALGYDSGAEDFDRVVEPLLGHKVETAVGPRPLGLAAWFPKDGGPPHVWMMDSSRPVLRTLTDTVLELRRMSRWQALGVSADQIKELDPPVLDVVYRIQPAGQGVSAETLRRGIGIALCYLTYLVVSMTGGLLLQSTMEEKSGRLLESLLAIAKPNEILGGKLAAMAGVALMLALVWSAMALAVVSVLPAAISQPAYHTLEVVASPFGVIRLIFYFVCGYLVMAMPFLIIGAMCETMQDAQPFQIPLICLFVPLIYIMLSAINSPDSLILQILSWVPFYTPFAMTARLGDAVPPLQILGTTVVMLGFVILEYRFMGRVFRSVLLQTGQSPKWRDMLKFGLSRG